MPRHPTGAAMPDLPLAGLRVLVTRPEGDGAEDWCAALADAGALPIPYPTITFGAPPSWQPLDEALAKLARYDWAIFTSQTAVTFVLGRLPGHRFPPGVQPRIAVIGPATARVVEAAGGVVTVRPDDSRQEGLARALASVEPGSHLLFPAAEGARTLLAESLRRRGCAVDVVVAYRTLPRPNLPTLPAFDVATFASPSALRAYLAHVGAASLGGKGVVVIGPTTAKEASAYGIQVVVAEQPGSDSLISAIATSSPSQGVR
jgi:uroporphyrinogen-III synthase